MKVKTKWVVLDIGTDLIGFLLVVGILVIFAYGWLYKGLECTISPNINLLLFGAGAFSLKSFISSITKWKKLL